MRRKPINHEHTRNIDYALRHFRFGWWSLLVFAAFGLALEALHGLKVGSYLSVSNETRRLRSRRTGMVDPRSSILDLRRLQWTSLAD